MHAAIGVHGRKGTANKVEEIKAQSRKCRYEYTKGNQVDFVRMMALFVSVTFLFRRAYMSDKPEV